MSQPGVTRRQPGPPGHIQPIQGQGREVGRGPGNCPLRLSGNRWPRRDVRVTGASPHSEHQDWTGRCQSPRTDAGLGQCLGVMEAGQG